MSDPVHLLPPNASAAERAIAAATARLADPAPHCRQLWSPTACPDAHLPWLAWAFSVDEWDTTWSPAQKRAVTASAFAVHQHKGTVASMRTALGALGYSMDITEWFQEAPPAAPYTFALTADVSGEGLPAGLWDSIEAVALAAKNARSHLRTIRLRSGVAGTLYLGGVAMAAEVTTLEPYHLGLASVVGTLHLGAAAWGYETVELRPFDPNQMAVLALTDGTPLQLANGAPLRLMN
ncbi:phage tail protein I [Thermomonas sp.]|uniref:phage tail protein I n=1 Tax=Thermomonas sp. TaxID=1971895 RepID=UPI0035B4A2BA